MLRGRMFRRRLAVDVKGTIERFNIARNQAGCLRGAYMEAERALANLGPSVSIHDTIETLLNVQRFG
jgi:hypothetical protein